MGMNFFTTKAGSAALWMEPDLLCCVRATFEGRNVVDCYGFAPRELMMMGGKCSLGAKP